MQTTETSSTTPHGPVKGIDGRIIIFASLAGCVLLFFIVWASLRSVERHIRDSRPDLRWADRADWHAPAVIRATLVTPNAAHAQYTYNKPRYRDPGFEISDEEENSVLACADLARFKDFTNDTTRHGVLQHAVADENFYAQYLLATWHRLNNQPTEADACYQRATDLAPNILVIQYTDPAGQPAANLKLDRVEIGCDRVTDEGTKLDQRLVLVYPHLVTDAAGRVYLPVYDTTYRPVHLPEPDSYNIAYTPGEGWFNTASRLGLINAQVNTKPGE